jgi:hypothetical protein
VDRRTRLLNGYVARVQRAAAVDPAVGTAFLRVVQLEAPPSSLLSPSVLARVVRSARRRPGEQGPRVPTGV